VLAESLVSGRVKSNFVGARRSQARSNRSPNWRLAAQYTEFVALYGVLHATFRREGL
jgi:hypothetical protein